MAVYEWSTTAASNASVSGINFAEGQLPSTLNNSCRELMAQVKAWQDAPAWQQQTETVTFVTSTSFSVTGDRTAFYHANRAVRMVGSSTGTIYGYIDSSSEAGGTTTVTMTWTSGSMQNEALTASVGMEADTVHWAKGVGMDSGTRMLFQQSTAPSGWTEETTYFNRGIRQTNSSNWNGIPAFTDGFTTVFSGSRSTDAYTLLEADIPSHRHFVAKNGSSGSGVSASLAVSSQGTLGLGGSNDYALGGLGTAADVGLSSLTGSGGSHSHVLDDMNLSYVDVIIAVKD